MSAETLTKYYAALQRLIARHARINNDTVALEAGCKKGSIKKSRPGHAALIAAIDEAANAAKTAKASADPVPALREEKRRLRQLLDESLEREINLLDELLTVRHERDNLRKQIAAMRDGKVRRLDGKEEGAQI